MPNDIMCRFANKFHQNRSRYMGSTGKVHPRTGYEGREGEQVYSSTLFLTSSLDEGGCSTPCTGRFTPGKNAVPIVQEVGWAPGPVWTGAENLAHHRNSIPGPSSPQRVAIPTELFRPLITVRICMIKPISIIFDTLKWIILWSQKNYNKSLYLSNRCTIRLLQKNVLIYIKIDIKMFLHVSV